MFMMKFKDPLSKIRSYILFFIQAKRLNWYNFSNLTVDQM